MQSSSPSFRQSPSLLSARTDTRVWSLILLIFATVYLSSPLSCWGWSLHTSSSTSSSRSPHHHIIKSVPFNINYSPLILEPSTFRKRFHTILASTAAPTAESLSPTSDDDDDDDEYEYVEYDILTDAEFLGSEWLVGTAMDNNRLERIDETWVRLASDRNGKNVAIWGDKSEGDWNFDVANQFLSVSKRSIWGKNIWAGVIDDYYYSRGTVRGWNFLSAASVVGQWQAKRLGVEADEAGAAPWFETDDDGVEVKKVEGDSTSNIDISNTN